RTASFGSSCESTYDMLMAPPPLAVNMAPVREAGERALACSPPVWLKSFTVANFRSMMQLSSAFAERYRIDRELGAGGMATVYLAHDLKHDRAVAIKILREELAASIGPERFLFEIKTTARLTHPHILPLHDSGEADGHLYYVMPFVDGETLRAR